MQAYFPTLPFTSRTGRMAARPRIQFLSGDSPNRFAAFTRQPGTETAQSGSARYDERFGGPVPTTGESTRQARPPDKSSHRPKRLRGTRPPELQVAGKKPAENSVARFRSAGWGKRGGANGGRRRDLREPRWPERVGPGVIAGLGREGGRSSRACGWATDSRDA